MTARPPTTGLPQAAPPPPERLWDLLAQRATDGLTPAEHAELDALLAQHPDVDSVGLDQAAAELFRTGPAAAAAAGEALPESVLKAAEERLALSTFGQRTPPAARSAGQPGTRPGPAAVAGWLVAAAALALAAIGWLGRTPATPPVTPELSAAQQRERFLAEASDVRRAVITPTADPLGKALAGEVVWSDARDEGYIRLTGLTPGAPVNVQYQLWVFDEGRTAPQPISAGLFDVPTADAAGELVIRLRPSLPVSKAKLFAISAEAPGGSVLPTMERVLMTAQ